MIKLKDVLSSTNTNVKKYIYDDTSALVEAVIYKYPTYSERTTICISTQSGCRVGCSFCGTGKKFLRNLTTEEILLQVTETFKLENVDSDNVNKLQIMFMSMGEPSHNWDALSKAIVQLNKLYPNAELLISTIGTNYDGFVDKFIELSKQIDTIGLQFSVHHFDDAKRNRIIPFEDKLSLSEISEFGKKWYNATGRTPFCNYVVTSANNKDYGKLFELFPREVFQFTFSVLCSPSETIKSSFYKNKDDIQTIISDFTMRGYNTRMFDPAGQDDIGGGCGQLWYFQKKVKDMM